MKNMSLAVLLGATVLFIWGFVSWAVLPWHNSVANKFNDEVLVAEVLKSNAPNLGVYYLPFSEEDHKAGEVSAFINVLPNGFNSNIGVLMVVAFLGNALSVLLVALLLAHTSNLKYSSRVRFVALIGLVIGFVSHFPYWNWFGFSSEYVLVIVFDTLIAWSLAGVVIAKFVGSETAQVEGV